MHILLTNDDGIFAPGIAAMERGLRGLGEVSVVAPSTASAPSQLWRALTKCQSVMATSRCMSSA
jgi:5'/3'-nucleotidase SurE